MGYLWLGRRDSDPCSLMCAAVMPFITMVSCLIETMKIPARRYTLRKPSAILEAGEGMAALFFLERG